MKIKFNIPQSWNELSDRQLKRLAKLANSGIKGVYFDYLVLVGLLNLKWWNLISKAKCGLLIYNVPFSELKKQYYWFYEELTLTRFIPSLKIKSKILYSPADRIINLTIGEFAAADDFFLGWLRTKDYDYLRYLAAVLYRECDEKGKRVAFDKLELDHRASLLNKVKKNTLLAILLSYQGCRTYLERAHSTAFPKPKKGAKPKKVPVSSLFGKIVLQFAGGKFGTYTETDNTNVYTFLAEFEEKIKENKLLQSKYKK